MFGLTLACAFAASTPTVVAKMPTLAIAIRARFMIYLPFEISSAEGNACVKANVPNDYRVIAAIAARGSFWRARLTRTRSREPSSLGAPLREHITRARGSSRAAVTEPIKNHHCIRLSVNVGPSMEDYRARGTGQLVCHQ